MTQQDFVYELKSEFERRLNRNGSYSLRAFAKALEIDQSLLTKILKKSRPPTLSLISKVAPKIGLKNNFVQNGKIKNSQKENYHKLEEDYFKILSEWYHFAILELIKVEPKKISSGFISKKLKIHVLQAEEALNRLMALGFIDQKGSQYRLLRPDNSWFSPQHSSAAKMKLQKELHKKSMQAIEDIPFQKRDHSSLTIACNPKHLPLIRQKITEFRRELDHMIEGLDSADDIYQLTIGFFPLTNNGDDL